MLWQVIKAISKEIEIDFLSLSFVREGEDLNIAREFLESIGATTTKVRCRSSTDASCSCTHCALSGAVPGRPSYEYSCIWRDSSESMGPPRTVGRACSGSCLCMQARN